MSYIVTQLSGKNQISFETRNSISIIGRNLLHPLGTTEEDELIISAERITRPVAANVYDWRICMFLAQLAARIHQFPNFAQFNKLSRPLIDKRGRPCRMTRRTSVADRRTAKWLISPGQWMIMKEFVVRSAARGTSTLKIRRPRSARSATSGG